MAELLTHLEKLLKTYIAPAPLDGHAESQLGGKSCTSGVIKEYNIGIQLICRMQLQEMQNGVKGVLTLGLLWRYNIKIGIWML